MKKRTLAEKWRLVSVNNKMIVYFTGLIAVATVLYALAAGWQLYEIHSGAKDTHTLPVVAKTQADLMKQVTEGNNEAICDVRNETRIPEDVERTDIVNTGNVNALKVTAHLEITRNELPSLKMLAPIGTLDVSEDEILKNKSSNPRFTPLHLTKTDRRAIFKDSQTIVVKGTLTYDNGFGTAKHHGVCYACVADPFQAERQQPPLP